MNRTYKEALLAVLLLLLPVVLLYWNGVGGDQSVDINVHDIYFVVPTGFALLVVFTLLYFPLYLIRALMGRFRNLFVNIILMALTIAIVLLLWYLIELMEILYSAGLTVYPPLSSPPQEIPAKDPPINYSYIYLTQALLLLLFTFIIYRTWNIRKYT